MKKIVIVAKNQETHFIKRFLIEAGQNTVEFFNPWKDLILPEADFYLARTTGIHHSDLDLLMLGSLSAEKVINSTQSLKRFRTKNGQYEWMEEAGFSVLPWLSLVNADLIIVEKFFRLYPEMIVKPLVGQGGWGVEVLTWDKFKSWWKKRKGVDEKYLIQPYKKDVQEYRYFFIKDEFEFTLKRKAQRGVAANFKNQGEAQKAELPLEIKETIQLLAEKSNLSYGAIDLLVDEHGHYILEVNSVPGIEQLEVVSGVNILKKFLSAKIFCQ